MLVVSALANAQTPGPTPAGTASGLSAGPSGGSTTLGGAPTLGAGSSPLGFRAPDASVGRGWTITPSIGLRVEATDNVARTSNSEKTSEVFLEAFPGVALRGSSQRLRIDASYVGLASQPLMDSSARRRGNTFSGITTIEAIDRALFLDLSGSIAQQYLSSFGPRQSEVAANDPNRFENRAASVSPYLRGNLGSTAQYYLRYSHTWSMPSSNSTTLPSSQIDQLSGQLQGRITTSTGWGLDYSNTRSDVENRPDRQNVERYYGTLFWRIDPELNLFGLLGRERNNYLLDQDASTTYGGGASWTPTERTRLDAKAEQRFFGAGYSLSFGHRHRQVATSLLVARDAVITSNQLFVVPEGDARALLDIALTSTYPDPVQRRAAVDQVIAQTGGSPVTTNATSLFTQRVLIQKRFVFALAIVGVRNTVAIDIGLVDSEPILGSQPALIVDDFSRSQHVKQTSGAITWTHRVSALSSISSRLSRTVVRSVGLAEQTESIQDGLTVTLVNAIGPKTQARTGLRVLRFDPTSNLGSGFVEKAVFSGLTHAF
ncbi:MAG: TIGR03016 family PEP-CTERM system-associated outer membrane protein [Burkholderiales bacterium]